MQLFKQIMRKSEPAVAIGKEPDLLKERKNWILLDYDGESDYFYKRCFEFANRDDSYEFITRLIQIHKNNVCIESEANDLGNILVKVIGDMEHMSHAHKVLDEVEHLYMDLLDNAE